LVALHGDVLSKDVLLEGFTFSSVRVPFVDNRRGIWKPRILSDVPLSIITTFGSPYSDSFGPDNVLRYSYQGRDENNRDNVYMRNAMKYGTPLIYFYAVGRGRYVVVKPVFVVDDHPKSLYFSINANSQTLADGSGRVFENDDDARREYATAIVRVRLHQKAFRERVMDAYRRQCAFCRLRHDELLDAAHIIPDSEEGEPHVSNGIALCKLHHAAFEKFFLGLRPDYVIEVRSDIRQEKDGPTLKHAIQGMHGVQIVLPRKVSQRPSPTLLEQRYELFKSR
jgi:putative restriction endonuclease